MTSALNHYLNFPYVRQAFMIERESAKRPAKSVEISFMAPQAYPRIMPP
ncbi:hypothetical protein NMYAN_250027 [Nitrosomonas nitrosa]|uniref:Uncharacterized protein n=1 Tax=Nitrosomonas nitrosa TaxID=52442 RepID=A0A8H8Z0P8_9PROT|nr:hypothetical protein NMYAN_250027 [Nitrosomonas nitrosa]